MTVYALPTVQISLFGRDLLAPGLCGEFALGDGIVDRSDGAAQFGQRLFDIDLLPFELVQLFIELLARMQGLAHAMVLGIVQIEDLADLSEGKADPASAQDKDDAGAIARGVDARLAAP